MAVFEFGLYKPDNTKPRAFTTSIRVPLEGSVDNRVDVTYLEQTNDDGTTTRTVECGLDLVGAPKNGDGNVDPKEEDIDLRNPVQTLFWNSQQEKYDIYDDESSVDAILAPIRVRECWCTRVFGKFSDPFEAVNPPGTMFCPLQDDDDDLKATAAKGTLGGGGEICTASAVFSEDDSTILAQESICFRQDPLSEFSKTIWPLCFFWYVLLVGILVGTHYGRRVRGFVWRGASIQKSKFSERKRERNQEGDTRGDTIVDNEMELGGDIEAPRNNNNNNNENSHGGDTPPDNPESTAAVTANPNMETENDHQDETPNARSASQETAISGNDDAIVEEFGSLQNYRLLDRELRFQAERTGNEFVTWLWYCAVYTEVRRYRYERFRRRQERRREEDSATFSDDDDDNDNEVDLMRNPSSRLDNVFWYPPASPEGERWEHLRNNGRRTHDENGNPVDGNRLRLKTKRFVMPKDSLLEASESEEKIENENNDPSIVDKDLVPECGQSSVGDAVCIDKAKIDDTPLEVAGKVAEVATCSNEPEVDAEIGDNVCSICLGEIEEGDLVGDIPCGHVFHKDCLKAWLVKNNHCPVCRMPGIASHPLLGTPAPTMHA